MKRPIVALAAAGVAVAAAGWLLPRAVPVDALREAAEASLSAAFGSPVHITGEVETRLLPSPRLAWTAAAFTDAAGTPLLTAKAIDIPLSLSGLLGGRVEGSGLVVESAHFKPATLLSRQTLERLAKLPPIAVAFEKATLAIGPDAATERIEDLDLTVERRTAGTGLEIGGAGRGRGETVTFSARLPGGPGATRWHLSIATAGATLDAGGERGIETAAPWTGRASLSLSDPGRAARLLGLETLADLVRAPISLEGTIGIGPKTATLADLRLKLGSAAAQGGFAVALGGDEPSVAGTLAFGEIVTTAKEPVFGDGWRRLALDPAHVGVALALRLSAERLVTPSVEVSRPAMTVDLAEGRLDARIGEATLWKRPVALSVVGDLRDKGLDARIRASAADLPAADVGALFAVDGIEGGSLGFVFEGGAVCATLGDCLDTIGGRLSITARDVEVTAASPFGDVTRFHPIVVGAKSAPKKTSWAHAEAVVDLTGTRARIDRVEVTGNDARFRLSGAGDLARGTVELAGHAFFRNLRASAARPAAEEIRIPLRVNGPIGRLEITPAMPEEMPVDTSNVPLSPIPIIPTIGASGG